LPVFPETAQGTLEEAQQWVVELPVKSPDGAIVRDQLSALDQLSYWLMWKKCWTEHNPSCTIYVHPDEWVGVTSFLRMSWDAIGGLSFLPKDTNIYPLAPYEEITKDEYERRLALLPTALDLHLIQETQDITTVNSEFACVGGLCEI
jgi:ribonucleoside-diphosphate reductase alpha chain